MLANFFRRDKKRAVFVIQITEGTVKVLRCLTGKGGKHEFAAEAAPIAAASEEAAKLNELLRRLKFNAHPVIVSLPRINAASRYLKIPAQNPAEIERIVSLQAPRYLPYSSEELNTGFQVIGTDKEGYSEVNLIIAHRDAVGRYEAALKEIKPSTINVFLSSFSLSNLYQYLFPKEARTVMLLDVNSNQAEIAIVQGERLLFSRSVKLITAEPGWQALLGDELKKTSGLYLKEVSKEEPQKILIFNQGRDFAGLTEALNRQTGLPAEELPYAQKLGIAAPSGASFAGLAGFAIAGLSERLNLLPSPVKRAIQNKTERRKQAQLAASACGLLLIFGLSLWRNLENKSLYLRRIESELNKISRESKPLEQIEKRFQLIEGRSRDGLSALDAFYCLHKNTPSGVSISDFTYDAGKTVVIRGQAQGLDGVFEFAARLQEAEALKKFDIKVKYATNKRTAAGEAVDFEIDCLKI